MISTGYSSPKMFKIELTFL